MAQALGGLLIVVKFVFGYYEHAELQALNRMRSVRRPFLLSLEKIDFVDGQLVVIKELGNMCLKVQFEECVQPE